MSSTLFKPVPFVRIPLVRYSVASKKFNKAEVQLLRDFPNVGVKGQVLKVSHSLMRNRLHQRNGACYILPGQGPRIPVVKEEKKKVVTPPPVEVITPTPVKAEAPASKKLQINIKGLLLNIPNKKEANGGSGKVEASKHSYSLFNLSVNLGDIIFKVPENEGTLNTSINKSTISTQIKRLVNVSVPESDIRVKKGQETVETIDTLGEYTVGLGPEPREQITKKIIVKAKN